MNFKLSLTFMNDLERTKNYFNKRNHWVWKHQRFMISGPMGGIKELLLIINGLNTHF